MRVLVIRPQPSASRTARHLADLGHEPVLLPLAAPQHDPEAVRVALSRRHSAIAITSGEAARVIADLGEDLDRHLLTTVFAVGRASARAMLDSGFRTVLTPEGDGRDLADLIIGHCRDYGTPPDPLLYLAGRPRAPQFEARLTEAAIAHETVDCYRMEPVRPPRAELKAVIIDNPPDAIVFYSRESAVRFFELPAVEESQDVLARTLFLCMSANVAAAVPERFAPSVVVSARPDEESLLDLL